MCDPERKREESLVIKKAPYGKADHLLQRDVVLTVSEYTKPLSHSVTQVMDIDLKGTVKG